MDGMANVMRLVPRVLAGLSLLLVIVNGALAVANHSTQAEVNARAQYVNQSVQLGRLEQAIVRAAAAAAINNKDSKLGELLTANGIRYQAAPNAAAPAAPAAAAAPAPAPAPAAAGGRRP